MTNPTLIFARYFATTEHVRLRGHTHGGLPYTHHLMAVEEVLRRFRITDESLLVAAWLHDAVEDCDDIKVKHIAEMFGLRVASLVEAVTKEPGSRKQSWPLTAEKIRATENAVLLKLADRIANVEAGGQLVEMYRKEHESFKHGLLHALIDPQYGYEHDMMWAHLNALLN